MAYMVVFFVHMLGLIALFGALVLFQHVGARLRRAQSWQDANLLLSILSTVPPMSTGGSVLLLVSGIAMAAKRWGMQAPWVSVGMGWVIILVLLGAIVVRPMFEKVVRMAHERTGPMSDQDRAAINSSPLWALTFAMNAAALALVWIMSTKPGWPMSIALPLVLAAIGWFVGASISRRAKSAR